VISVDPTSTPADPTSEQTLTSLFAYDGLGRATRQAVAEPHHTNRVAKLDVKLGLTTPVASAGVHVGVDVNGQPCSDPQDNSATCRTSLTPFAGHPTDVTYDGLTPIAWSDTTSSRTLNTIYGPEGVDQQTDTRYGVSYFHLDLLGSTRALTNTAGATVAAGAYDDWGNPQPAPGQHHIGGLLTGVINLATGLFGGLLGSAPRPPFASLNSATPVGYTSQVADPTQGLIHFHARTYLPGCAAWLQADPHDGALSDPERTNHYAYVKNSPISLIDVGGADPAPANCPPGDTACYNAMYGGASDPFTSCLAATSGGMRMLCNGLNPIPQTPAPAPDPIQQLLIPPPGGWRNGPTPPTDQQHPAQATPRYDLPLNDVPIAGSLFGSSTDAEMAYCSHLSNVDTCGFTFATSQYATQFTVDKFGNRAGSGVADAYLHMVWMGLLSLQIGADAAQAAGTRHEDFPQNDMYDKDMALTNNAWGTLLAEEAQSKGLTGRAAMQYVVDKALTFACSAGAYTHDTGRIPGRNVDSRTAAMEAAQRRVC
jgi:RHS repeat-associated protein